MPPYAPGPHITETEPAFGRNRYGRIVVSTHSNAARRCAVPACAAASSPGRYHTDSAVPAAVVPSGSSVYASMLHAIWYDGASLGIAGGNTATWPAGAPVTSSENVVPSSGFEWHGNRFPQKYGHTNV